MSDNVIELCNVERRFGSLIAVNDLDLNVPAGSVFGFLGPNGAGKSTTIRLILGLLKASKGEINLFNEPFSRNRLSHLKRIGALVENPSLYPNLTGYENMMVVQRLRGCSPMNIREALNTVGLANDAHRLVKHYSLGMKHRLGLAAALMDDPELLILDEPTNGLDPAGILEMRDLIRNLPEEKGVTVFLSSHLLSEIEQVATHIGIINRGRLLFEGTLEQLYVERKEHILFRLDRPQLAQQMLNAKGIRAELYVNGSLKPHVKLAAGGDSASAKILSLLVSNGFEVYEMQSHQSTLEDLFIDLTTLTKGAA